MRDGRLPLLLVGVLILASCGGSPTAPSNNTTSPPNLATSIALGNVSFNATSAYFWRDWMPVVQKPGPDGGSPLMATIDIAVDNTAGADRVTLTAAIRDSSGKSYPTTLSAIDMATGKDWDGAVTAGAHIVIRVTLREGPYLPLNSKVFAVLTCTAQSGGVGSMRTPEGQIQGTT